MLKKYSKTAWIIAAQMFEFEIARAGVEPLPYLPVDNRFNNEYLSKNRQQVTTLSLDEALLKQTSITTSSTQHPYWYRADFCLAKWLRSVPQIYALLGIWLYSSLLSALYLHFRLKTETLLVDGHNSEPHNSPVFDRAYCAIRQICS